jgi:hypothetical protein
MGTDHGAARVGNEGAKCLFPVHARQVEPRDNPVRLMSYEEKLFTSCTFFAKMALRAAML